MDEQNELERSISDAIDDEPHQNARTECRKRVFLFNCDSTYSLDSVEKLLLNMKGDIRQELSFDIVKTSFRLSEMSHVAEKAIPKLQMDVAFFVVHANESRLSINEENAGIGYAKLYKALLQATDGKVIVVIGGDDHYKNQDEEESYVISRWVKRKVSSQFKDEFLDGRKSFIFSWNKSYRKIHEEALLHYFDPSKSGQKFEWKPNDRPRVPQETPHKTPETEKLEAKEHEQFTDHPYDRPRVPQETLHKTPETEKLEAKEHEQFTDHPHDRPRVPQETLHKIPVNEEPEAKASQKFTNHPHATDIAHSSVEEEVNKQTSVSEARCYDKGDKLKEEGKKDTEGKDPNGDGLSEGCTREIASRETTETEDDYVMVNEDDHAGFSKGGQMNGKTKHGTLVMKTKVRNGSFSFRDEEREGSLQWKPPDKLLPDISEKLEHVAEAEVEIYLMEETGAVTVITREVSNLSVIYAMIKYVYEKLAGMFHLVCHAFLKGNEIERGLDEFEN